MKPKTQAKALAFGGTLCMFALAFGNIDFSLVGLLYCGFTAVLGFSNWIDMDRHDVKQKEEVVAE